MTVGEREIEACLIRHAEKAGGKAYKFTSPGCAGVPDRLVALPGGIVFFVELKAPGEKPRPLQEKRGKEITELGVPVFWIDSKEEAEDIIRHAMEGREMDIGWRKWRQESQ